VSRKTQTGEPTGQDRRSADTREKILEVAEREFALAGYDGAHLQRIAERVGVQKTALYYYFPSKGALYLAVLERIVSALDQTLAAATEQAGPAQERFERLLDDVNDLLAEHRYYSKILLRIFVDRAPVQLVSIGPAIEGMIGRVLRFYRRGVEEGAFRRISARHFFLSVLGATLFPYAAPAFSARVLDVEDVFTASVVAWRREEVRRVLGGGALPQSGPDPKDSEGGS
jgi:TetR/AcrR family transcriptional regulator